MEAEAEAARRKGDSWRNLLRPATALAGVAAAVVVALALAGHPGPRRVAPVPDGPSARVEAQSEAPSETKVEARLPGRQADQMRVMLGGAPELCLRDRRRNRPDGRTTSRHSRPRQAPSPGCCGRRSWVQVFAGTSSEARLVIDRLAAQRIAARLEPTDEDRAKVSVRPADAKGAKDLIRVVQDPHAAENAHE